MISAFELQKSEHVEKKTKIEKKKWGSIGKSNLKDLISWQSNKNIKKRTSKTNVPRQDITVQF